MIIDKDALWLACHHRITEILIGLRSNRSSIARSIKYILIKNDLDLIRLTFTRIS